MTESGTSNGFQNDEDGEMTMYKKDATSVITFKIVYSEDDFKAKKFTTFKPEMAHQVFGESESIFGYRSVSISLYYLHNSSNCYVDLQASGHVKVNNLHPDDIMKSLNSWLPESYVTDQRAFERMLKNEHHDQIFGTVLHDFKEDKEPSQFCENNIIKNYKVTICDTSDEDFQDHHRRFETFIVWFIDAANFIDLEDERWMIFYVYEEFEDPDKQQKYISPVGFCSAYKFYAYPNNVRARISQFFVLPSHQKKGIGKNLYRTVARRIRETADVIDVTVEEPTPVFQRIRDLEDCRVMMKNLEEVNVDVKTGNVKEIFELMRKQKICRKQCQRVYDLLGCYQSHKSSNEEYKKSINQIRNRIRHKMEKEARGSKRMNLNGSELTLEPVDKTAALEAEFKNYISDIEQSLSYLQKHL